VGGCVQKLDGIEQADVPIKFQYVYHKNKENALYYKFNALFLFVVDNEVTEPI
jgi:hypothetical protein